MDLTKRLGFDPDLLKAAAEILGGKNSSNEKEEKEDDDKEEDEKEETKESYFFISAVDKNGKEYFSDIFETKEIAENISYKMRKSTTFKSINIVEFSEDALEQTLTEAVPLLAQGARMAAPVVGRELARRLPSVGRAMDRLRQMDNRGQSEILRRLDRNRANDNLPAPANTNVPAARPQTTPAQSSVPTVKPQPVTSTVRLDKPSVANQAGAKNLLSRTPNVDADTETQPDQAAQAAPVTPGGSSRDGGEDAPAPSTNLPRATQQDTDNLPTPPRQPTRQRAAARTGESDSDRLNAISLGQSVADRGGTPSPEATPRNQGEADAAENMRRRRREIAAQTNEETVNEVNNVEKGDVGNISSKKKKTSKSPGVEFNPKLDIRKEEAEIVDEAIVRKIKSSKRITKALQEIVAKGEAKEYTFEDGTTVRIEPSMARIALQKYNALSDFERAQAAKTMRNSYKDFLAATKGR